MDKLTSIKLLY